MSSNFQENTEKIIAALSAKLPDHKCPICRHDKFNLGAGYFAHDLQKDLESRRMGGPNIPTVPVICKNCGFVMEFAAGSLDLLPPDENEKK